MNFYLEKVNGENNIWINAVYITLILLILHLLYNLYCNDNNEERKDKNL